MARWRYTLKTGKELREVLQEDNCEKTLNVLDKCWREIYDALPDEYDEDDLANDLANIENELDNVENYESYDMTYEDVEDNINYLLSEFYDFCDNMRIWVEL